MKKKKSIYRQIKEISRHYKKHWSTRKMGGYDPINGYLAENRKNTK